MTMTDHQRLEAAAKAAGIALEPYTSDKAAPWGEHPGFTVAGEGPDEWNPLADDGQALRLAAALNIDIEICLCYCEATTVDMVKSSAHRFMEDWGAGPTMLEVRMRRIRRAIVRAAAAAQPAPAEPVAKPCEWTTCPTRVGNVCCNDRPA
jgi:hypothetical protein